MQKTCIVCKQLFTPTLRHNNVQITCGPECRYIYNKEHARNRQNMPEIKERRRKQYYDRRTTYCQLCGKPIERLHLNDKCTSTARMHEECVVEDCRNALLCGQRLTHAQQLRLLYRGYGIREFFYETADWRAENMPMTAYDEHMMRYVPQQFQLAVQSLVHDVDKHTYTVEYRTAIKDGEFMLETKTFTATQAITRHFSAIRKTMRLSSNFSE